MKASFNIARKEYGLSQPGCTPTTLRLRPLHLAAMALTVLVAGGQSRAGQVNCDDPNAEHGAGATKACSNRCVGETMSCTATFFNLDGFEDSLQLLGAFDTVDGSIRVPASGNLPIISVQGNAVCTGASCNPATGANCSFPCLVCTAGTSPTHGGLTCPGLLQAGAVRVRQNTHVLTHTGSTPDTINFIYEDNCDSGCSNCPTTQLTTPAASSTVAPDCSDGDPCTNDDCDLGVCANPSVCEDPNFCDDGDPCTADTCNNDADLGTECCSHVDICQCGDGNIDVGEYCDGTSEASGVDCNTDGCRSDCTCCGDDVRNNGEQCDGTDFEPGAPSTHGPCRDTCTFCGDGTPNGGEQCDDGNSVDDDACRNDCTLQQADAICRTPGFWGTHGGTEKNRSSNITQAVINAAGGELEVCGECISTTTVNNAASALEAICVSPSGAVVLQNARQLTALALNCIMSGFGADCGGDASLSDLFDDCNNACLGLTSDRTNAECRDQIDCFNNGGRIQSDGKGGIFCQTGTCTNGDACNDERPCSDGSACAELANNCHERELCNPDVGLCFDPPGPAGSSNACHAARDNHCAVLPLTCSNSRGGGSGESCCASDSCP